MDPIRRLNSTFAMPDRLQFQASPLGGIVASIAGPSGSAVVALKGAQVLEWRPAGQREVLWCSPLSRLDGERAVRGGIPVCWPWFGPHPSGGGQPVHGFARTALWQPRSARVVGDAVRVEFAFSPPKDDGLAADAELAVVVGATLRLELRTRNRGPRPIQLSQALHTYFSVSDVSGVAVEGLDGTVYADKLRDMQQDTGRGRLAIDREIDRIYATGGPVSLIDPGFGRRLEIGSAGTSRSTVVWNPWVDKSARLGDMPPESYRGMLCIETANAGDDARTLPAGGLHTLVTEIAVHRN